MNQLGLEIKNQITSIVVWEWINSSPRDQIIRLTGVKVLALTLGNHVWQMPIWEPPFICSVCPVSLTSLCWSVTHTPPSSHSLRQSYADHDFWNKGVHAMILQWFNGVQMTHASRHNRYFYKQLFRWRLWIHI